MKFIIKVEVEADSREAAEAIRGEMVGGAEDFAETQRTASASIGDVELIGDERHAALVELARDAHAIGSGDDIEVDEDARTSEGEDGIWVQGWLFLSNQALAGAGIKNDSKDEEGEQDGND